MALIFLNPAFERRIMKGTLLAALILMLIPSPAFCIAGDPHVTRLRLERATTLGGDWEHVPAETMPIEGGEFEDSFNATTAFYRLRIEVLEDDRPPAAFPLSEVPVRSREIAQQHLDDNRDIGGDNAWEDAELAPVVFAMYNPAVQGPAYFEFKVIRRPEEPLPLRGDVPAQVFTDMPIKLGFILVSATRNDFPIVSYATQGPTRTEMLREMAKSTAVRIFRYDSTFYVAENPAGEIVAHLGSGPVKFPETICDFFGKEFHHIVNEGVVQEPEGAPDLTGEAFGSYAAFKQAYMESEYLRRARRIRAEQASLEWDLYDGIDESNLFDVDVDMQITVLQDKTIESFVVGDPSLATITILPQGLSITGKKPGGTVLRIMIDDSETGVYALIVTDEGTLSPDKPTGWGSYSTYYAGTWSDQRKYEQRYLSAEGCYYGCGPVAWGMLFGWFDYMGYADLIAGSTPAKEYLDGYAGLCVYTVRGYVNTYCVGDQGATNPWNMPDGYKWVDIDRGISTYSIATTYSIPCVPTSGCRDEAVQSIRYGGKPAVIGLWCFSMHYCVAYGYRYRQYTVSTPLGVATLWTDHDFKCNLGAGMGSSPSWETGSIWYGNNPHFW
jgi:hypothetical protein